MAPGFPKSDIAEGYVHSNDIDWLRSERQQYILSYLTSIINCLPILNAIFLSSIISVCGKFNFDISEIFYSGLVDAKNIYLICSFKYITQEITKIYLGRGKSSRSFLLYHMIFLEKKSGCMRVFFFI